MSIAVRISLLIVLIDRSAFGESPGSGYRVRTLMIVDTSEEAAALDQPPLLVRRPLEAFLDAHGLGSGELTAEPIGEGHSNVTFLIGRGGEAVGPAPPAPAAAAAVGPRRAARGVPAARARGHGRARPARAGPLRRRGGDRRAVLRDGAHRGDVMTTSVPDGLDGAGDRRGADRRAGGDPRRRLAGLRAGGLRQAERLPRAPAAPLRRAVGAQPHAPECRRWSASRPGWASTCRSPARPRSSTATTGSAT